jgi:amino acid adenylation domain-containing protein
MEQSKPDIVDIYELSPLQQGMLFHALYAPGAATYNIQLDFTFVGELDAAALEAAWALLAARHAPLRTSFVWERVEKPYQVVRAEGPLHITQHDLTALSPDDRSRQLAALLETDRALPFDLAKGPLIRLTLIATGPAERRFVWTFHHIILEGWSASILLAELWQAYRDIVAGRAPALPRAPQYVDYIKWLRKQDRARAEAYWREALGGITAASALPIDAAGGAELSGVRRTESVTLTLAEPLTARLKALAQRQRVTLNTVVQAMWSLLLSRYSGETDVVFDAAVAGRPTDLPEADRIVGLFVNVLPVRVRVPGRGDLGAWLRELQLAHATMREYEYSALVQVKTASGVAGGRPLFTTAVAFENWLGDLSVDEIAPGLRVAGLETHEMSDQPLTLFAAPGKTLTLTVMYDVGRFERRAIERLATHCRVLLEGMVAADDVPLEALDLLGEAERRQLLEMGSGPRTDYVRATNVVELIEAQARQRPEALAVEGESGALRYAELDAQANRLAAYLRQRGVGRDVAVAVLMERRPELVVAQLGIMKAGGAYVPIDPSSPAQRVAFVLADTGSPVLVTQRSLAALAGEGYAGERLCLDEASWRPGALESGASGAGGPGSGASGAGASRSGRVDAARAAIDSGTSGSEVPGVRIAPSDLAYVIYTSGSTGEPKGVEVPHAGLLNLVSWHCRAYEVGPEDRASYVAGLGFDATVWELWPALAAGASVHLAPESRRYSGTALLEWFAAQKISLAFLPTPLAEAALRGRRPEGLRLRVLMTGGDRLHGGLSREPLPFRLVNHYGPTENSVVATCGDVDPSGAEEPTIGRPIDNVRVYVLDELRRPAPMGVAGELYLAGQSLARGYLKRPELTAEKFIADPFRAGGRLYRTGDKVRWREDGELEFLGRLDQQVKLRGFRIELGEIETALCRQAGVRAAAVTVREEPGGWPRLVAYVVAQPGGTVSKAALRTALQSELPAYMVPAAFVPLEALPLTANGKVDLAALPEAPADAGPIEGAGAPRSDLERRIAEIWRAVLKTERVGVRDNFFDLGGHSLLMAKLQSVLKERAGIDVALMDLFRYPTIEALASHLASEPEAQRTLVDRVRERRTRRSGAEREPIAIVGMAGRFPGADSVDAFWDNLAGGVESIRFFSEDELRSAGVPEVMFRDPHYVPARGYLEEGDCFDAAFFGYSPREAELIDPQQRVFLECAWTALEHAGYDPARYEGAIGVFAGTSLNTYMLSLTAQSQTLDKLGGIHAAIGADKDFLATRVAYKLDLRGPSMTVQAACSTSLVAVHQACRGLLAGDCDMALAGGVSVLAPRVCGYVYQEQGILAADGHCRPFSADAGGTVGGEGVGIVVLKRLSDALADGDHVVAVILGSAINNDGSKKIGYTAPSVGGQAEVIALAQLAADVKPESIGYIEAHGTGTSLGDPIEVAALTQVFGGGEPRARRCALGSVKSNVGHLDAAAGATGLIKAALALKHRQLPPSLNFSAPNPKIDFDAGPFYVNATLADWETAEAAPRRAGVSSFGIGGTNAHVILEEAPPAPPGGAPAPEQLLVLSARTETALDALRADFVRHLERHPEIDMDDAAYTLKVGRAQLPHRLAVVCRDRDDAAAALEGEGERLMRRHDETLAPGVVLMFPGQGAQYPGMGRELYRRYAQFRTEVDRCCDGLRAHLGFDLRACLYPGAADAEEAGSRLAQTAYAQPALFCVEYALASLWMSWGVRPEAMIGHSIGEFVAACLAGVFTLEEALAAVSARGRLMQAQPPGAMLAVPMSAEAAEAHILHPLCIAAVNSPSTCVVAGPAEAVAELERKLSEAGHPGKRLHTSHAFHSAMMQPAADAFTAWLGTLHLRAPRLPYVSSSTGAWITDAEAVDPAYWGRQLREPVRFSAGVDTLLQTANRCFIEAGPGNTLVGLLRQHRGWTAEHSATPSMRHAREPGSDTAFMQQALGRFWLAGGRPDWTAVEGTPRRRLPLPTYPFERERYWIDAAQAAHGAETVANHGALRKRPNPEDWCFAPVWKSTAGSAEAGQALDGDWLLLAAAGSFGARLAAELEGRGARVVTAHAGAEFAPLGERAYSFDPTAPQDFARLLALVEPSAPLHIVHALSVGEPSDGSAEAGLSAGFYSLLYLLQALDAAPSRAATRLDVLTQGAVAIGGEERLVPALAAAVGLCRTLPQEMPSIACRVIDVDAAGDGGECHRLLRRVVRELCAPSDVPLVAFRHDRRWVPTFENLRLPAPTAPSRLRAGGTYLITGGLGNVGLALAQHLARDFGANLVLTSRGGLPARHEWERWLAEHDDADATSVKIRAVQGLEAEGAEVIAAAADAGDLEAMRDVVAAAQQRFGAIHGVIHGAGVTSGASIGVIERLTRESCGPQFDAKPRALEVLSRLFDTDALDFVMTISSLSSELGGLKFGAYAAANRFMDALCLQAHASGRENWIAVNWDAWRADGAIGADMASDSLGALALTESEGRRVFDLLMRLPPMPQVLVSTVDLNRRLARTSMTAQADAAPAAARPARHERPRLATEHVAPATDTEHAIAGVWSDVLGIESIGIRDSFFELGGHSLLAVQVVSTVRDRFAVRLTIDEFLELGTVEKIAACVDARRWVTADAPTDSAESEERFEFEL